MAITREIVSLYAIQHTVETNNVPWNGARFTDGSVSTTGGGVGS